MIFFWKHKVETILFLTLFLSITFIALTKEALSFNSSLEVISPYLFIEKESGKKYSLYGIHHLRKEQAPLLYRDSENISIDFTHLTPFHIEIIDEKPNRYGYYDVVLWNEDKTLSLQELMLKKGLTKLEIYDEKISNKLFNHWQDLDRGATFQKPFTIKDHQTVEPYQFQIIRAAIRDKSERGQFLYINFDTDWRKDFTVMIPKNLAKQTDPSQLEIGRSIQIRGYVESYYGPMIKLSSLRQIE